MAKKIKQPSKIAKLTAEFKSSGQSQDAINASVEQRIRDLEEIGLSLATAMKGITSHLISSNITAIPNTKLKKEEVVDQDESTILQKMYNFMISESEKREKKKQLLKIKKREERKQKLVRLKKSFKMAVRQKMTPTTGGVLKTMGIGLIGSTIAGLAWVFQDEIKKYANSIKDSIMNFKTFIIEKFQIVSSFLKRLDSILQPIKQWFGNKVGGFIQSTMQIDTSQGVYDGIKKWVTDFVVGFVGDTTDRITGWLYDIGQSIKQWALTPFSVGNYQKIMATLVTRLIAGPLAATGVAAISAGRTISEGVTQVRSMANKEDYGDRYISKVQELIQTNSRHLRIGSLEESVNDVISKLESGDTSTFKKGLTNEEIANQQKIIRELQDLKKQNYAEKFKSYGYEYVGPTSPDMPDAGFFKNAQGDIVSLEEANKKLIQLKAKNVILTNLQDKVQKLSDQYIEPVVKPIEEMYKGVSEEIKSVSDQLKKIDEDYALSKTISETATRSVETAQQTVTDVGDAFKEETANVATPTDALVAGFSLGERGLEKTIQTTASLASKGMENIKPTLEKLSGMDFQQKALDSYSMLQNVWGKIGETAQTFSNPEKFDEFMTNLSGGQTPNTLSSPVPANSPNIQPDPNENLLLKEIMGQVSQAVVNNNTVVNSKSSSEEIFTDSPRIRDNNTSIQRSSLQNTSPWDMPFSFAR